MALSAINAAEKLGISRGLQKTRPSCGGLGHGQLIHLMNMHSSTDNPAYSLPSYSAVLGARRWGRGVRLAWAAPRVDGGGQVRR